MGQQRDVVCKNCGHAYLVRIGGGFQFMLLHCDRCGLEESVTIEQIGSAIGAEGETGRWIEEHVEPCGCGGRFTPDAPPRCPKCKSDEFEDDQDRQRIVLYD